MRFFITLLAALMFSSSAYGQICGEWSPYNRSAMNNGSYIGLKTGEIDMRVWKRYVTDSITKRRAEIISEKGTPLTTAELQRSFEGRLHSGKNVNVSFEGWGPALANLTLSADAQLTPRQDYQHRFASYLYSGSRRFRAGRYIERHNANGSTNYFQTGIAEFVPKQCDAALGLDGVQGKWSAKDDQICYATQNIEGPSCFTVYAIDDCFHYVSSSGQYDGHSFLGTPDVEKESACELHSAINPK